MLQFKYRPSDCAAQPQWFCSLFASLFAVITVAMMAQSAVAAPPARLNAEQVVRDWAKASQAIVPLGKTAQQRTIRAHEKQFNGHQISLINEFRGPVDAVELLKRYRFTKVERTDVLFRLTAVPRDDVERLFVAEFDITFSDDSHFPISLQFLGADGEQRGDSITLLTRPPQRVVAVFDQSAVKRKQSGVRVAAAVGDTVGKVRQANVEFSVKQGDDAKRLQEVLNRWKAESLRTKTMSAKFRQYFYDHIFHTETRSQGTLFFEAPDKARIETKPSRIPAEAKSRRLADDGIPYQIRDLAKSETWIWWTGHCCRVSHESKEIEVFVKSPIPPTIRRASFFAAIGDAFVDSLQHRLPIFGAWSPRLETDFEWSLVKDTTSQLHLKGIPQSSRMKRSVSEIVVLLDSQTYRTRAVKFVDPGGNSEIVYSVYDVVLNVDEDAVEFIDQARFEAPELPGYKTFTHGR